MANYTVNPTRDDGSKVVAYQTDGSTQIADAAMVYDGGTAAGLGTAVPSDTVITGNLQVGGRASVHGSQVVQSKNVFGAFQSSTTAITSVADDGNGFCDFTLATHGLSVGDVLSVTGSTSGNVDGVQKITSVPDANSFVTDKAYTAAATAGSYATVAGNFATLTAEAYIMLGYASSAAGGQKATTGFGADHGIRRSIHKMEAMRTYRVATAIRAGYWDEYTGTWSTAVTSADDISDMGTDEAATPSYATPGELVYRVSGQPDGTNGVTQGDYPAKQSSS